METFLIEKQDNFMRIGIRDADATLIAPLLEELNKAKDVEYIRYVETHPELDTPEIQIKMKSGSPSEAIKKAAEKISAYFVKA